MSACIAEKVRRRGPSWQLLTPPPNPSGHRKGTFLPPRAGNWNINSLQAKFILAYCWAFWTHWGSHLESSDDTCWISERTGWGFAEEVGPVCFIVSTDNKSWLQLFFPTYDVTRQVLILPSLGGMMGDRELLHQPVWCCATVKSWCEYSKKVYDGEIHGCKFYLPAAFHCAWHISGIFLIFPPPPSYTSSFSWVHTLQYNFRRTWLMKIPLREPCLGLEWGGKCQKHCQRRLIFPRRLAANIQ